MLGPEGNVQKWFGIFTDIHDRKVMELDLSQQAARLLGANERLNQFAYAVSHDLQEPLRMSVATLNSLRDAMKASLAPTRISYPVRSEWRR